VAAATGTLSTRGFRNTSRIDKWWLAPALQFGGFGAAIVYSTWAAFQGSHFSREPYLSPFYSPTVLLSLNFWPFNTSWLAWAFVPISPALIILPFPLGFRLTCYYYRKMYYRTYFSEPPACAVGELGKPEVYAGETRFPFVLLNLHRYFMYAALAILVILSYDTVVAFNHSGHLGIGLGTVVLLVNTATLGLYTFSCHSLRHLIGGRIDCFSCTRFGDARYKGWKAISKLNEHHMLFAWISLGAVCFADFYVRLLAGGIPNLTFVEPVVLIDPLVFAIGLAGLAGAAAGYVLWMRRKPSAAAPAPA
jgi:hypothetical protein